jgi:hypothetical protein
MKGRMFFFEKKNQKTLDFGVGGLASVHPKDQKSFAAFLQKRRSFFLWLSQRGC